MSSVVRRPDLEEWFIQYQLRYLARHHFHIPLFLTIDFSRIRQAYRDRHRKPAPLLAIMVRALSLLARRRPEVNRVVFRTLFGTRIVEPDYVAVNLPILLTVGDRRIVSAITVRDADRRALSVVQDEISASLNTDPSSLPIARMMVNNRNTLLARAKLRLIHFLAFRIPSVFLKKGGGGISMSSFMYLREPGFRFIGVPHGPTAFTVGMPPVLSENGRSECTLGVGFDHLAMPGHLASEAMAELSRILHAPTPEALEEIIGNP